MTKKIIFFDADDTLWENEGYFRNAEKEFAELLHMDADAQAIQQTLWEKQEANIPLFGYGSKTYMLGMTDTAIELCGGSMSRDTYYGIKKIITELAFHELHIIRGVEQTLETVRRMGWDMAGQQKETSRSRWASTASADSTNSSTTLKSWRTRTGETTLNCAESSI